MLPASAEAMARVAEPARSVSMLSERAPYWQPGARCCARRKAPLALMKRQGL